MPSTPAVLESLTGTVTRDASFANADVWLSTHSANPGSTGAHELTSGSGDEGRQNLTFNSGGSGSDTNNVTADVTIPGAQTIPWVGLWDAQTDGTFLGGYPLVSNYQIAVGLSGSELVYCPAHGLVDTDIVRLFTAPQAESTIPAGLSGDPSVFYVVSTPSVDELTLSATLDGSPVTLSSSGGFLLAEDGTQVFGSMGGVLEFSIGNAIYATVSQ